MDAGNLPFGSETALKGIKHGDNTIFSLQPLCLHFIMKKLMNVDEYIYVLITFRTFIFAW